MGSRIERICSRMGWSWSGWNHPKRAQIVAVILILVGGGASGYLQGELAHQGIMVFEQNELYGSIATVVSMLIVYFVGMAVLALVD